MTRLPDPDRRAIAAAAISATRAMRYLSTGAMAELRRMDTANPAAAYWKIAVQNPVIDRNRESWVTILRIMALLMPKGEPPPEGRHLHNGKRPFGRVLCDGGDPAWLPQGDSPDGVFGERRLMQLLATRGPARAVALERAARMLAPRIQPGSGVDVAQIALALLDLDDTTTIAQAYFRRLDGAIRTSSEEKTE
ncbi:MAG: hypothetical protein IAE87_13095 [Rhodobacteraceae bacterium]|jgi:hypothetical protein|nr:hypothetical protein [Paracoccaceae bacterium]